MLAEGLLGLLFAFPEISPFLQRACGDGQSLRTALSQPGKCPVEDDIDAFCAGVNSTFPLAMSLRTKNRSPALTFHPPPPQERVQSPVGVFTWEPFHPG